MKSKDQPTVLLIFPDPLNKMQCKIMIKMNLQIEIMQLLLLGDFHILIVVCSFLKNFRKKKLKEKSLNFQ